ncbi:uncharacterized protein [Linepithema humile]|uniref:uncharacterized protein n=1 Tax=Linepithema humile TaxID=83485 RepID=UPI0006238AE5|nr:PREDICTED: uncharacterized protein LOC105679004 [Linepithema humile]
MEFVKLIFDNMDTIIKSAITGVVIEALIIGYKTYKKRASVGNVDNPNNVQWKKIGRVDDLIIYPVKSSAQPVRYDSFAFCDYGMCRQEYGTYFWDGMFLLYNKTKDKFEDSQRYRFLQSVTANLTNTGEVTLSSHRVLNKVKLDIDRYRNPSNRFVKETWNGTSETIYGSDLHVNTWLKEVLNTNEIVEPNEFNKANVDITLAQMLPQNWNSTQRIKENLYRFRQGYEDMKFEKKTGKFITLPRFVLMTSKTFVKLDTRHSFLTPNIIIETGKLINPFEEKNWKWIKIGDEIILRNVKPVPRRPSEEEFKHFGIYCALWTGGNVKLYDKVYIDSESFHSDV